MIRNTKIVIPVLINIFSPQIFVYDLIKLVLNFCWIWLVYW